MKARAQLFTVLALSVALAGAEGEKKKKSKSAAEPKVRSEAVVDQTVEDADPFAGDWTGYGAPRKIAPTRPDVIGQTVLVRAEFYEVKTATVIALLDAWEVKAGAGALRGQALDLVKNGEAQVADVIAGTVEAGTRHEFAATREYIYPTEYEPPEGLSLFDPKNRPKHTPWTDLIEKLNDAAAPTAFETRNLGRSLSIEVQPVRVEDDSWDVSVVPESVALSSLLEWGAPGAGVKLPEIITFRSDTVLRVRDGEWSLVCTQTPFGKNAETKVDVKRMVFLKIERAR